MRERTRTFHRQAERSGIIRQILRGHVDRYGYALLLRNLLPVYQAMERELRRRRDSPGVRQVVRPELARAGHLRRDLERLSGPAWRRSLPLLPAARIYVQQVKRAADADGTRLVAHAYVRYLGDLNGGQILNRIVARSIGLASLAFHEFDLIADLDRFATAYRESFDMAAAEISDQEAVIEEAVTAFRLNILMSEAVLTQAERRLTGMNGDADAVMSASAQRRRTSRSG